MEDASFAGVVGVEAFDGPFVIQIEDLAEGDGLLFGILEGGEEGGVMSVTVSEILDLGFSVGAHGSIVCTAEVGSFVAFILGSAGSDVVIASLRADEKGEEGIDDGGFSGAIFAYEQGGLALGVDGEDGTVEGSPVIEFEFGETKAERSGAESSIEVWGGGGSTLGRGLMIRERAWV